MFYYILNIKMTSQSLSSFVWSYKQQANSCMKFDNDCDVIFMFKCNMTRYYRVSVL